MPLTDSAAGRPFGAMPIPGRPYGLEFLLDRTQDGVGTLIALPYAVRGTLPDGTPDIVEGFPPAMPPMAGTLNQTQIESIILYVKSLK